jgi:hypothetical protein
MTLGARLDADVPRVDDGQQPVDILVLVNLRLRRGSIGPQPNRQGRGEHEQTGHPDGDP